MCGPHLSVFFGNQTIGSGCNVWLSAQEGAGSPHRYSHQDGQCRCTDRVCVGHTYLFFGNQTIGSGCNMWLAAQEGAGSPRGENSHISSASGGSGPIYAPGGVGEVIMGRPLGVGAGQGSRGDHEWLKRLSLDRNWFAREAVIHVDVRT